MLFYANGKEVVDSSPDAIPAHRRCIDWYASCVNFAQDFAAICIKFVKVLSYIKG